MQQIIEDRCQFMLALIRSGSEGLNDQPFAILIDHQSRQIIVFSINQASCFMIGNMTAQVDGSTHPFAPEIFVNGTIFPRQHTEANIGLGIPEAACQKSTILCNECYDVAGLWLPAKALDGTRENPRMTAADG